jgi:hypothetical protein
VTMRGHWPPAVVVAALCALGPVLGCGSGSETTSSEGLSRTEFISQGNAICSKRGAQISTEGGRILQQSSQTPDKAQAMMVDQVIIPNFEEEIRELRSLDAPATDSKQVDEVLTAIQDTVDRLRTAPPIGASASFKANHPYRPGEEIAAEYGLTACGHP